MASYDESHNRIWEIDFIRGVALLLMILFHTIVDLRDFFDYSFNYMTGFWYYEGKLSAILFILLAGISCAFSRNTTKHGLTVFIWGMLLTIITYIYNSDTYIRFGILHLLGISILSYRILKWMSVLGLLAWSLLAVIFGVMAPTIATASSLLLPFGITPVTLVSIDYYPLFPWHGTFTLGIALGKSLYTSHTSRLSLPIKPNFVNYIGQHSLFVYLAHQPIVLAALFLGKHLAKALSR